MEFLYPTRDPEPDDVEAIAAFRALIGDQDRYLLKHRAAPFYWAKYFTHAFQPACVRLAEDEGTLVGTVALTFKQFKLGSDQILSGELGDLFTHPEHRRKGIFKRLTTEVCDQAEAAGCGMFWVRPNDNSFPGLVRMGFEEIFQLVPMVTILDPSPVLQRRVGDGLLFRLARPFARMLSTLVYRASACATRDDIQIERVSNFDERADELWTRASAEMRVANVRNRAYLTWRYVDCAEDYLIFTATSGPRLLGFVVTSSMDPDDESSDAHVVELLTDPSRPEVASMLLARAVAELKARGADVVRTWAIPGSDVYHTFRRAGLRPTRQRLHFVLQTRGLSAAQDALFRDSANWYFTMGDTDGI